MSEIFYEWNEEKNVILKNERDVSFEDVIFALKNDKLLDIILSPTHKGQQCFVVNIKDYAYVIPYVRAAEDKVFLKTIYPSRKYTKIFLKVNYEK